MRLFRNGSNLHAVGNCQPKPISPSVMAILDVVIRSKLSATPSLCSIGIMTRLWANAPTMRQRLTCYRYSPISQGCICIFLISGILLQVLHRQWRFPNWVTLMEGGTQGFSLLTHVQATTRMIIFDAIDYGLPPGTLKVLSNEQVPRFMVSKKLSLHQTGFQPRQLDDFGGSIRPVVKAQIQPTIDIALDYLRRWGCEPQARDGQFETNVYLQPESLDMEAYESGSALAAL